MQIVGCCFQISSVPAVKMLVAMIKDGETVLGPSSRALSGVGSYSALKITRKYTIAFMKIQNVCFLLSTTSFLPQKKKKRFWFINAAQIIIKASSIHKGLNAEFVPNLTGINNYLTP